MDIRKDITWRVSLSFLVMALVCVGILARVLFIQNAQGKRWRELAVKMHTEFQDVEAERGTIYSEDGQMLSTSIPKFNVHIDFTIEPIVKQNGLLLKNNIDTLSMQLANLFQDKTASEYKKELMNVFVKKQSYYFFKKRISFQQRQELLKCALVKSGPNKGGFIIDPVPQRFTPFGLLANRTIGLSRLIDSLNVGLEKTYDSVLRGQRGKRLVKYIAGGVKIPVEGGEIEPENGKDIFTTIDVNMQDIAETALMRMMKSNEALEGTCIIMEVATGKIKAIANIGKRDTTYGEFDNYALRTSEPGSTIKLVTLLSVLEDKYVNINNTVRIDGGHWQIGNRTIVDAERSPYDVLTVKQAFQHSSNVAMSKLAYYNYLKNPKQFYKHYEDLKLTQKSGIDLSEEFKPRVKNPETSKNFTDQTLQSMGFGYEVMLSPLQLLMVYNAVANNGVMMKPYLVNKIEFNGKLIKQFEPNIIQPKICSDETLKQLKLCLEAVCDSGTAEAAFKNAMYRVGGKTGTAKVADGKYKYDDLVYQTSFIGYFPAEQPLYSCAVVIKNKPRAVKHYGGTVSAPVFREVADKLFLLNMAKNKNQSIQPFSDSLYYTSYGSREDLQTIAKNLSINLRDTGTDFDWRGAVLQNQSITMKSIPVASAPDNIMPYIVGMGLKDAIAILETRGLKISVKGKGKVIQQSIESGRKINKGQNIIIQLG